MIALTYFEAAAAFVGIACVGAAAGMLAIALCHSASRGADDA